MFRGHSDTQPAMRGHSRSHVIRVIVLVILLVAAIGLRLSRNRSSPPHANRETAAEQDLIRRLAALESRENEIASTVWKKELLAQRCGRVFEDFWDALNAATNKLAVAGSFPVGQLILP